MNVSLSLIAAIDENRGLGKDNKLLFSIPEDLKHFKSLTLHHVVIMGRKTFESIGKSLPNRTNIVVTRDMKYRAPDCLVVHSLNEAITTATKIGANSLGAHEIFIIGGGSLYAQAIDRADRLYLTVVKGIYDADTFFPDYSSFSKVLSEEKLTTPKYSLVFLTLTR